MIFLIVIHSFLFSFRNLKTRKLKKRQTSWEQQRLYNIKNPLMGKPIANPYGSRGLPNGHSSSTYSTGDGAPSEYVESLASFKRSNGMNVGIANGVSRNGAMNKNRQQVPPDGASSLNPPRSPRFSDRYRANGNNGVTVTGGHMVSNGIVNRVVNRTDGDWFEGAKEQNDTDSVSGYSRGSGRSARSGYSGATWSSGKSRTSPATEL